MSPLGAAAMRQGFLQLAYSCLRIPSSGRANTPPNSLSSGNFPLQSSAESRIEVCATFGDKSKFLSASGGNQFVTYAEVSKLQSSRVNV